jgi:hypothetical protein
VGCTSLCVSGNSLFLGCGAGIFRTEGKGGAWTDVSTGLPAKGINSLRVQGAYLFAGAGFTGVWRRALTEIVTGVAEEGNLPASFALEQNYPNPFNPATAITFRIGSGAQVSLAVFDVLGRQVAALLNEQKAPGAYTVRFSGEGLASGIYFCRLQAGSVIATRKMILMK